MAATTINKALGETSSKDMKSLRRDMRELSITLRLLAASIDRKSAGRQCMRLKAALWDIKGRN